MERRARNLTYLEDLFSNNRQFAEMNMNSRDMHVGTKGMKLSKIDHMYSSPPG